MPFLNGLANIIPASSASKNYMHLLQIPLRVEDDTVPGWGQHLTLWPEMEITQNKNP